MARYLVTGGCGFIGSHLVAALLMQGDEVRVLDNLSTGNAANTPGAAELMVGDVCDAGAISEAMHDIDGCFHLAAVASVERCNAAWVDSHRTNLTGTITLLEAARRSSSARPVPVVYASSAAVYGDNAEVPLREQAIARPRSPYGADKFGSELHAFAAHCIHGISTVGLRFFNVYGPGQDPRSSYSGVISQFCQRLCTGREITVFGDGRQTRDFIYVADVVHALATAMRRPQSGASVMNVCTGRPTSVLDLAFLIGDLLGTRPKIEFKPPRRGDIRASIGDPSNARTRLGFAAETGLRKGLEATLKANAPTDLRLIAAAPISVRASRAPDQTFPAVAPEMEITHASDR
jgi:UDP-glucose 4-epimerase